VPEDALDALYGLPLDEFTPRRDELAKELRASGRREEAAWVKGLRKPSAAAWLVNQLARTQKKEARRVLDSGDALRAAQDHALAGKGGRDELATAGAEHADAMRTLLAKAPGLLDSKGGSPSQAVLERAAETLRAVALDEEARAGFASGRLTRERQAAGLGFMAPGDGEPAATPTPRKGAARGKQPRAAEPPPDKAAKAAAEERERAERARAAVSDAKSLRRARKQKVAELERELGRAEREARSAQRRVDKAAAALERAREKEADSQARLEQAEADAKRS
jgi:hypothetical protein